MNGTEAREFLTAHPAARVEFSPSANVTHYGGELKPELDRHVDTPLCECKPDGVFTTSPEGDLVIIRLDHNQISPRGPVHRPPRVSYETPEGEPVYDAVTEMRRYRSMRYAAPYRKPQLDPALKARVYDLL
jgi:hypothetical protein